MLALTLLLMATPLEDAESAFLAGRVDESVAAAERAVSAGGEELAASLDLLAVIHASARRWDAASAASARSVALAGDGKLGVDLQLQVLNNALYIHTHVPRSAKDESAQKKARAIEDSLFAAYRNVRWSDREVFPGVRAWLNWHLWPGGELSPYRPVFAGPLAGADLAMEDAIWEEHPTAAMRLARGGWAIVDAKLPSEDPRRGSYLDLLAAALQKAGEQEKADETYRSALALVEGKTGFEKTAAFLHRGYGTYLAARERYPDAETHFSRAVDDYRKILGEKSPALASCHRDRADARARQGKLADAIADVRAAREIDSPGAKVDPWNDPLIARLLSLQGRHTDAQVLLERVVDPKAPDYLGDVILTDALDELAQTHAARGKLLDARNTIERARIAGEKKLTKFLSDSLGTHGETELLEELAGMADRTDLAVWLAWKAGGADGARSAFTSVLRTKGRALDVLSLSAGTLRGVLDPEAKAKVSELREAEAALSAASMHPPRNAEEGAKNERLQERIRNLQSSLFRTASKYGAELAALGPDEVRLALPKDAALVEVYDYRAFDPKAARPQDRFGARRYAAWVLRADGSVAQVDLGEAGPLEKEAAAFRVALANPRSTNHAALARSLDERVMRPVRALLGDATRLIVAPSGALNSVPFAALLDERGVALLERFEIEYAGTGRDLLREAQPSRDAPLVLGDPAYATAGATPAAAATQWAPLPGTRGEAESVAAMLPDARLVQGAAATEAAVKALRGPRVLHLATHGFFLGETGSGTGARGGVALVGKPIGQTKHGNPLLRSGLALAGANALQSGSDDGILTALEAAGLDLVGTDLVVLSACETALGEIRGGEGVFGLRRALTLAGAENLVMSLWKVDDLATRDLMKAYYGNLTAGGGRISGLRVAALEMRKDPARQHPYYWAAFIASGRRDPLGTAEAPTAVAAKADPRVAGPRTLTKIRWKEKVPAPCYAGPVIADGVAVLGCEDGSLIAFDATTGKRRWLVSVPGEEVRSDPAIADGTVFAATRRGNLLAVDLASGAIRWKAHVPGWLDTSPVVDGDAVIAGSTNGSAGSIRAFAKKDGAILWRSDAPSFMHADLVVLGPTVYAASSSIDSGELFALDRATGKELWREKAGLVHRLFAERGHLLFSSRGTVTAVDVATRKRTTLFDTKGSGVMSVAGGRLAESTGGSIVVHDLANGRLLWRLQLEESGQLALTADRLYLAEDGGTLRCFELGGSGASTLTLQGDATTAPVAADGRVYVATDAGWLYAAE